MTAGDDGILRPTNALSVWVRPNFTEFEKIGVCELNHCETQDDHCCDHFEEGEEPEKIEVIKRPRGGIMSEYERTIFDGICPYTGKHCKTFECDKCEIEAEERKWHDELDEVE